MDMPGRKTEPIDNYKYSFNGKLDDKSDGWQTQDYGDRSYDYRLGRFLSTDPLTASFAYLTPYQFASNRPVDGVDLDGKEWSVSTKMVLGKNNKPKLIITLNVKVGFHHTEGLPKNFIKMAELYVESLYKAHYTSSDGTKVEIETTADFYEVNGSESIPISFNFGDMHPLKTVLGQTMDNKGGDNPNSQDAYITLFKKHEITDKNNTSNPGVVVATSVWDLIVTIAHELGHTVGLAHDGNGVLFDEDAMQTDEHNLMYWLGSNDTKAHLETFQILKALIHISNDLKNIKPSNKNGTNKQAKPDILGKPTPSNSGGENNRTA